MKGRARKKNNSFKVFTNDVETTKNNIKQFVLLMQEMKEFFKFDFVHNFFRKNLELEKSLGKHFFKFKNSQVKITLKNVLMLYHVAGEQLELPEQKKNRSEENQKPEFESRVSF